VVCYISRASCTLTTSKPQQGRRESGAPDISYHLVKQNLLLLLSTEQNTQNQCFLKAASCTGLQQATFTLPAAAGRQ